MRFQAALTALLVAEGTVSQREKVGGGITVAHARTPDVVRGRASRKFREHRRVMQQRKEQLKAVLRPLWEDSSFTDSDQHVQDSSYADPYPCDPDVGILVCEPGYICVTLEEEGQDDQVQDSISNTGHCLPQKTRLLQTGPEEELVCEYVAGYLVPYFQEDDNCRVTGFENNSTVGVLECTDIVYCNECDYGVDPATCLSCQTDSFIYECNPDGTANAQFCGNLDCYAGNLVCGQSYCYDYSYAANGDLTRFDLVVDGRACETSISNSTCVDDDETFDATATCTNFAVSTCIDSDIFGTEICADPFAIPGVTGQGSCVETPRFTPVPTGETVTTLAPTSTPTTSPNTSSPTEAPVVTSEPTSTPTTSPNTSSPTEAPVISTPGPTTETSPPTMAPVSSTPGPSIGPTESPEASPTTEPTDTSAVYEKKSLAMILTGTLLALSSFIS